MEIEAPEFTLAEILELQGLYKEKGEKCLSENFCQEIATRFSLSSHRAGTPTIPCKQVQCWFHDKHKKVTAKDKQPTSFQELVRSLRNNASESSSPATFGAVLPSDPPVLNDTTRTNNKTKAERVAELSDLRYEATLKAVVPSDPPILNDTIGTPLKSKAERVAELSELRYEALSAKDGAWFDVASFLNYRVLYSGELEARVRFSGFNHDEDEWVNVRRGIRDRSIPLEPSECHKIKVGDHVLCFRKNEDYALYGDARIMEIERNPHDAEVCSCIFVARYVYDGTEAKVDLSQICCRPASMKLGTPR